MIEDGDEIEMVVEEDEKTVTGRRVWAFDQLLHIIKAVAVPKDDEILAGLLEFFAVLGWFQVRKSGKGAVRTPFHFTSSFLNTPDTRFDLSTAILHSYSCFHGIPQSRRSFAILFCSHFLTSRTFYSHRSNLDIPCSRSSR